MHGLIEFVECVLQRSGFSRETVAGCAECPSREPYNPANAAPASDEREGNCSNSDLLNF
jgi:hypothetical protein